VSAHVVPKASLHHVAEEEKTAVDSSWEEEQSTIDQSEMAEKVRRALLEKRRAGTGNTTATTGHTIDEPTVEERHRASALELATVGLARLTVEVGPDAGKDFAIKPGQVVLVGRAIDNNVVLTDLSVSRKHFELSWGGGRWTLTDRGSGNGTLLNGKLQSAALPLQTGDQIEIGNTVFRFEQLGQPRRGNWGEEELSTQAGRRAAGSGARPSAAQTSEFESPGPHESIPVPLERRRGLPPPRGHAGPPPPSQPYLAPPPPSYSPLPSPQSAGGTPVYAPSFPSPAFQPFPGAELPRPTSAATASGNRPAATLPGRPPLVGPTAPPQAHDGLVPPRQPAAPAEMASMMATGPRVPMVAPMARPQLGGVHQAAMQGRLPMHASRPAMGDSGVPVSGSRFAHAQAQRRSSRHDARQDALPRARNTKVTMAIVAGGLVLLVAVVALAMGASDELKVITTPLPPQTSAAEPLGAPPAGAEPSTARARVEPVVAKATTEPAAVKPVEERAALPAPAEAGPHPTEAQASGAVEGAVAAAETPAAAELAAVERQPAGKEGKRDADKGRDLKAAVEPAGKDVKKPRGAEESDGALLERADALYRKKNFTGAAALLREAIKGRNKAEELRAAAQLYEALQRTYSAGVAAGAKPTTAYTNLHSAAGFDDKLGKAHAEDIAPRLIAAAPRAAAQFVAIKQYEDAYQALRDAERGGSTSSTLPAVRAAIEAHAAEIFSQAQSKRDSEPAEARALYRRVLKLVDTGSALHQRASKAVSEL
jgi:Inner membrane component of T3SS, cytoplasmic domain